LTSVLCIQLDVVLTLFYNTARVTHIRNDLISSNWN